MNPPQKHRHDGKIEVRSDYVCLASEYHNLHSLNDLLQKPPTDITEAGTKLADVADQRPLQQLLSASLHSSGSKFVFSAPERPHLKLSIGGLCIRVVRIEEAQAHLGDDTALTTLLASIPLPPFAAPLLHRPFFARKWDCTKQRDHWVASDGTTVVSLEISGASASTVARMRLRFDDLRIVTRGLQPSLKILHDLLEEIAREDAQAARR